MIKLADKSELRLVAPLFENTFVMIWPMMKQTPQK